MSETVQNTSLTLGFFGDQEVHRTNMRDNLEDFIEGHFKKSHRNATVRCIICVEPWTNTMADIADWALTSGYHLGLLGHADAFENPQVAQLIPQASGLVFRLDEDSSNERVMVLTLASFDEARLILLADPNEDDDAYSAFVIARDRGLKVKSLLEGMDRVIMDVDDEDQEQPLHLVEDSDDEELDDTPDDDDEEGGEIDLDQLAQDADEGDKEAAEELSELAQADGIDSTKYDTWLEVVVAMREGPKPEPEGAEDDEGYYDAEAAAAVADVVATATEPESTEPEPEGEPEEVEEEPPVAPTKTEYTEKQLQKLVDDTTVPAKKQAAFDRLIDIGAEVTKRYKLTGTNKIEPGRGHKPDWFMRHILAAQGGPPIKKAPAKKAAAKKVVAKKAVAKKASATKKRAPTKAAAKKTTAKRAPAKKTAKRTAPLRPVAASANGHVDKAALRSFIKTARAALDVAESMM